MEENEKKSSQQLNVYEIKIEEIKINADLIPPLSKMTYRLSIENKNEKPIKIDKLDIKINIAGTETPFIAENVNIQASEVFTTTIERRMDLLETITSIINIKQEYKIKGEALINNEKIDINVKGKTEDK